MKTLLVLLLTLVAGTSANAQRQHPLRKLQLAEMAISQLYVDSVNQPKLVEDAIRGMLKELDPHSSYSTAKETKALNEPLNGSFDGIGIQFNMVEDTLLVIQPVSKGPSEKVGILAGDRIITVADTTISGVKMERSEIMRRLRGPRGSKIKLGIKRRGVNELLYFTVTRGKIPVYSVDAYYMIRPHLGYIRIGSFGATTYGEFMKAVDSLQTDGMRDLIIDLQDNGGGYLQASVKIIEEFLQKNDLIVYTEGRAQRRMEYRAPGNGRFTKGKVYVLVNEYTASAAEILSGAMQDQDRGTIIGRRSFGKGLVQRPIEFDDGSMIRLTIAHYYTPSGRCIQKPYAKGDQEDYAMDIEKRYKHGELYSADSIHFADSLKCQTLRRHRTVYGRFRTARHNAVHSSASSDCGTLACHQHHPALRRRAPRRAEGSLYIVRRFRTQLQGAAGNDRQHLCRGRTLEAQTLLEGRMRQDTAHAQCAAEGSHSPRHLGYERVLSHNERAEPHRCQGSGDSY